MNSTLCPSSVAASDVEWMSTGAAILGESVRRPDVAPVLG
jgi:hypothetical protein